jgi:hypothetical protein
LKVRRDSGRGNGDALLHWAGLHGEGKLGVEVQVASESVGEGGRAVGEASEEVAGGVLNGPLFVSPRALDLLAVERLSIESHDGACCRFVSLEEHESVATMRARISTVGGVAVGICMIADLRYLSVRREHLLKRGCGNVGGQVAHVHRHVRWGRLVDNIVVVERHCWWRRLARAR